MKQLIQADEKRYLFNILVYFDDFCKRNHLKYSLDGGTLLGAVRHRGFIPWDDDIDVTMLRPEYERFRNLIVKDNHPYYKIHSYNIDKYPVPFCKLSDERTVIKAKKPIIGINIDIFPQDYVTTDLAQNKKDCAVNTKLWKILLCKRANYSDFRQIRRNVGLFINKLKLINISACDICEKIDKNSNNKEYYNSGILCDADMMFYINTKYEEDWLNEFVKLDFEGAKFPVFHEYDKILSSLYGDYMKLPPLEKRQNHGYIAYLK
jgi:lipopolysaccharide cholinephosphotransferase